eukprot:GFYU01011956.1.p1 GENE.GFYU01011956.1~~GFYU01011956.1.p1  ORF type:complete len:421 (+),score=84.36 GFYU01011956.1:83-1345(+)
MFSGAKRKRSTTRSSLSDYEILGKIGEGTFGVVYKAKLRPSAGRSRQRKATVDYTKTYAIKKFKVPEKKGMSQSAIRELSLLKGLEHENIVNLVDIITDPENMTLSLVFEYAEHEIYEIIKWHREKGKPIPEERIKSIMWQLIDGINYLHQNWVIHRDLKPANILVMDENAESEAGRVKIADFGLARIFQSPQESLGKNGTVVTIWYRAPELLLDSQHYTPAVDMWAIGCIFAELLTREPLFRGKEEKEGAFQKDQLIKIISVLGTINPGMWPAVTEMKKWKDYHILRRFPRNLDEVVKLSKDSQAYNLLCEMLTYDPAKRITAKAALDHGYFKTSPVPEANVLKRKANSDIYPARRYVVDKDAPHPSQLNPGHTSSNAAPVSRASNASGMPRYNSGGSHKPTAGGGTTDNMHPPSDRRR